MYKVIRYIHSLGDSVWTVVAESTSKIDAEHARDFFEANWPWEETGVPGRIYYYYEVHREH